jgi:TAG lipase/steryl ester hydrolase/phospholipase A2/LPA acyltransferase
MVRFMRQRVLVDSAEFRRCTRFYYGDMTFAEAYERTKKHVSITVSMSQLGGGAGGPRRLLLNHITSPHVTLASAVAASCALPGIMKPNKLEAKNKDGKIVPFEVDGVDFIDGSIHADLPFKRMATMFNVSNFIVSQVNFHANPFLRKHHSPSRDSLYWQILSFLELDIRSRAQALAKLGLLPTFFGQNVSGVFKQKYHGDVTIVPKFKLAESFGLKAVMNPPVEDMRHYITGGQQATWPHVNRIKHMMRTEKTLRDCMASIRKQASNQHEFTALQSSMKNMSFSGLHQEDEEDGFDSDGEEQQQHSDDSTTRPKVVSARAHGAARR